MWELNLLCERGCVVWWLPSLSVLAVSVVWISMCSEAVSSGVWFCPPWGRFASRECVTCLGFLWLVILLRNHGLVHVDDCGVLFRCRLNSFLHLWFGFRRSAMQWVMRTSSLNFHASRMRESAMDARRCQWGRVHVSWLPFNVRVTHVKWDIRVTCGDRRASGKELTNEMRVRTCALCLWICLCNSMCSWSCVHVTCSEMRVYAIDADADWWWWMRECLNK